MNIAVIGTGMVGQSLAEGFDRLGHSVVIGTRDPEATRGRREPDMMGAPGFGVWYESHGHIPLQGLSEAAASAELVVNATRGLQSVEALELAGEVNLAGKVLLDVANALDFSTSPPSVASFDEGSLAQAIQQRFPDAHVVKSLNTMNAHVMLDPASVAGGEHTVFVCGNDAGAKETVAALLAEAGWSDVLDLGGIEAAGSVELMLPVWLSLMNAIGSPAIQFKIAR